MGTFVTVVFVAFVIFLFLRTAIVVPQQNAFVVERLGRFNNVLEAGFHILVPFVDQIRYKHTLKEQAIDIPEQECITKDNVMVGVDGILYLKVLDPERASYGISNYGFAITQLAQTTLRSEIGRIDLDRTFEERTHINGAVVSEVDKASEAWGVKVLRYEIKDLTPPAEILHAMQRQITAEREKRALIAASEGRRQEQINIASGEREAATLRSEGERQAAINRAQGEASAIVALADASAAALRQVGAAIREPGGMDAVNLRVAEHYVDAFGKLAKTNNSLIVPANMGDMSSVIASALQIVKAQK
jgi:regulator of protease activity HflC (stomatin/prohibitin superfamily)